ncbi:MULTISPECIES: 16S rRNA (guanine(527)-N(7))-methyltransferase RsmG [unclassified Sphingomonas]|uniref:16S rRNA (guanine(527)-N(7))-methyltransferase RsmG n=1 Tax=unclassified Sphingomonas TaxID=196159 RepID=UPI0006F47CB4|nr:MULTISPECIES: 16S rRNA (guanine(527)-N(7))-methyltransferase RsmG [unclassified Sphingomonas]KQM62045.1 16S rRNA (guanine(527)-N(7))-methyltransferase RsmG [Sphingomonas sp. Leaf16]KQN13446.1 16S rRNA (guanine(527)-N(7))-methyltransferase RsmG [Sphingomonas sp. Leaf29]KQN23319.1 16S rRNA (guanine(527)-N(7))-methyltransferase RsmG [Sphingomonas sp. Leaf32]
MTEQDARRWIEARFGVERTNRLAQFADRIVAETANQNLIAASTIEHIWERHLLDSAQLVPLAEPAGAGDWIDIGSGAGFPGIVAAILTDRRIVLVEPRARRAALLGEVAADLKLSNVVVHQAKIEKLPADRPAAIITARAVARLAALFAIGHRHSDTDTIWVLPKGRSAAEELVEAKADWRGMFHVEHSITDPTSSIVVAKGVRQA